MAGIEPGLWAVEKGNKGVAEAFLNNSKASLLKATVKSVSLIKDKLGASYKIEYQKGGETNSREYDIVIIATPLETSKNKISLVNFPSNIVAFSQPMHRTVAMFTQGRLNASMFDKSLADFPSTVLTVNSDVFFNAVGEQTQVDPATTPDKEPPTDHAVWKTFLNHVPLEKEIDSLFDEHGEVAIVDWLAYPDYKPGMDLPPFVLYDRLYYVNAIESAASAMEMSVIGGKNVALLAYNQWYGHFDKIDETSLPDKSNDSKGISEIWQKIIV